MSTIKQTYTPPTQLNQSKYADKTATATRIEQIKTSSYRYSLYLIC